MKRFGEKLKILRERKGLTMRELAPELGFSSHGTIGNLETGRKYPSAALVLRIAEYFDVTTDQLLKDNLEV